MATIIVHLQYFPLCAWPVFYFLLCATFQLAIFFADLGVLLSRILVRTAWKGVSLSVSVARSATARRCFWGIFGVQIVADRGISICAFYFLQDSSGLSPSDIFSGEIRVPSQESESSSRETDETFVPYTQSVVAPQQVPIQSDVSSTIFYSLSLCPAKVL